MGVDVALVRGVASEDGNGVQDGGHDECEPVRCGRAEVSGELKGRRAARQSFANHSPNHSIAKEGTQEAHQVNAAKATHA